MRVLEFTTNPEKKHKEKLYFKRFKKLHKDDNIQTALEKKWRSESIDLFDQILILFINKTGGPTVN